MTNNFKSICIKTEFSAYHFIDYTVFEIIDPRKKTDGFSCMDRGPYEQLMPMPDIFIYEYTTLLHF